jgi:hypothetical protein
MRSPIVVSAKVLSPGFADTACRWRNPFQYKGLRESQFMCTDRHHCDGSIQALGVIALP